MKTIILAAGQGRRLLPLTTDLPKCLLEVQGKALLHWQLDALAAAAGDEVVVVVGFGAEQVEAVLARRPEAHRIRTVFNPFYAVSNNLASCWVAREEFDRDCLLLNGDVVFQSDVIERMVRPAESPTPVFVAVDFKDSYDDDDMKVCLDGERLVRIGKDLPPAEMHAEAIGVHGFRGRGPGLFREALERAVRRPGGLDRWYLTVVDELARTHPVGTASVEGLEWAEIDTRSDLADAGRLALRPVQDPSPLPA